MSKARHRLRDGAEEQLSSIAILDSRQMDDHGKSKPSTSTRMWRLRPLIFLPAS
jgi:hypothetical protein